MYTPQVVHTRQRLRRSLWVCHQAEVENLPLLPNFCSLKAFLYMAHGRLGKRQKNETCWFEISGFPEFKSLAEGRVGLPVQRSSWAVGAAVLLHDFSLASRGLGGPSARLRGRLLIL